MSTVDDDATAEYGQRPFEAPPGATEILLVRHGQSAPYREGYPFALVDGQDATLKYLRRESGMVRLDPANAAYEPQRYLPSRVRVQGRLVGLLRRYH